MKKLFYSILAALFFFAIQSIYVFAQNGPVVECPEGDFYTCYTWQNDQGESVTVYKGSGKTIVRPRGEK